MPLTKKGEKIKMAMEKEYGHEKGEHVFYASENSGKIKGVAKKKKAMAKKMNTGYEGHKYQAPHHGVYKIKE